MKNHASFFINHPSLTFPSSPSSFAFYFALRATKNTKAYAVAKAMAHTVGGTWATTDRSDGYPFERIDNGYLTNEREEHTRISGRLNGVCSILKTSIINF